MKEEKTFTYKFWINHIQFKQDTNHTHLRQEMWKQNKKRKQKLPISLFLTLREMTSYISDWRNRVTRRPPSQKTKQPRPRKSTRARAPYPVTATAAVAACGRWAPVHLLTNITTTTTTTMTAPRNRLTTRKAEKRTTGDTTTRSRSKRKQKAAWTRKWKLRS